MSPTRSLGQIIRRLTSGDSLVRHAAMNSAAGAVEYLVRIAVTLVINPLLLAGLGPYGFGAWQVLRQLVGYAGPATGRPTQALRWITAREQSSTDDDAKRENVGSAVSVALMLTPLVLAIGAGLAWTAPVWTSAPPDLVWVVRAATAILVLQLVMATFADVPRAVLDGENLAYRRVGVAVGISIVGGLAMALAVHFELGIPGVAASPLLVTLLEAFLFTGIARREVRWFGLVWPRTREARNAFLGLSGWFLAWRFINQALRSSDLLILGTFGALETVSVYSLTRYVPEAVISMMGIALLAVMPGIGGIIGRGDTRAARALRGEMAALTWSFAIAAGATILFWNASFVGQWVGDDFYAGPLENLAILTLAVQYVFIRNDAGIIDLSLALRQKVLLGALTVGLSVGLAILALAVFDAGLLGLCVGLIVGRMVLTIGYPILAGRVVDTSPGEQLRAIIRPGVVGALMLGVSAFFGDVRQIEGWVGLFFAAAATFALSAGVAFLACFPGALRRRIGARIGLGAPPR